MTLDDLRSSLPLRNLVKTEAKENSDFRLFLGPPRLPDRRNKSPRLAGVLAILLLSQDPPYEHALRGRLASLVIRWIANVSPSWVRPSREGGPIGCPVVNASRPQPGECQMADILTSASEEMAVPLTTIRADHRPQEAMADLLAGLGKYEVWVRFAFHD